jgi:hypothetical protein
MVSFGTQPVAFASSTSGRMVPELLVRAGTTGDVYAMLESETVPGQNLIEVSTEGDKKFQPIGSLPLTRGIAPDGPSVQQLLFANEVDGAAVLSGVKTAEGTASRLYVTHDGGRSWIDDEISPTTQIRELASTPNYWYAITSQCPSSNAQCSHYRLERAPVTTMRWTNLPLPHPLAEYGSVMNLTAFGSDVWLSTMDQDTAPYPSYIAVSHNLGQNFSVSVHPVLNAVTACGVEAMSYDVVWAICNQGMMAGQIPYSDDGGYQWSIRESSLKQPGYILSSFAYGSFDPVTSSIAFAVDGNYPDRLYRIANGFTPPEVVGTIPNGRASTTLCFVNEHVGFVLIQGDGGPPSETLLYTNDGGVRWSKVQI